MSERHVDIQRNSDYPCLEEGEKKISQHKPYGRQRPLTLETHEGMNYDATMLHVVNFQKLYMYSFLYTLHSTFISVVNPTC